MLLLSLFLSACNFGQEPEPTPDVDAIFRAAAETVQAEFALQLTQTALAAPTATPPPPTSTATQVATFAIGGTPAAPVATLGVGTQPTTLSVLATATPLAALATQAEQRCRDSAFVADVTYPDGTVVEKNAWLAKVWSIQNTGTCAWDDGFSLKPVTGDAKGEWVIDEKKEFVDPNEIVEVRIDIKTPSKSGEWGGCWRMMGDDDYYFGTYLCLLVMVD
jgi:hypothetical protein